MGISGISPAIAANVYSAAQNLSSGGGDGAPGTINATQAGAARNTAVLGAGGINGGDSFLDLVRDNIRESVATIRGGETMSAKAVAGEADLTDVVQAVNAAEVTLQSVVALRDRMISAYQEIMRLTI